MSIYQEIILHEHKNPRHFGVLSGEDVLVEMVNNPLCGDKLTFYALVKDGVLQDISYDGIGCAISIASASLLTDSIIKKDTKAISKLLPSDILSLLGIELSPNRLKCALLPLEGVKKVLAHKK